MIKRWYVWFVNNLGIYRSDRKFFVYFDKPVGLWLLSNFLWNSGLARKSRLLSFIHKRIENGYYTELK